MLAQHSRTDMGRKTIDYVGLYGAGTSSPCFAFHIVDYREPGQNVMAVEKDSSMSLENSSYSIMQEAPGIVNG